MKKVLFFLTLLIVLLASSAVADEWKNYHIDDYVFMLPDSYPIIYKGMPKDSLILKDTGLDLEQAEMLLDLYEAKTIFYTDDYSCTASITKIPAQGSMDYELLSDDEFNERLKFYENDYDSVLGNIGEYTINDLMVTYAPTDFAKYIFVVSSVSFSSYTSFSLQAITVKNGYQTVITFSTEDSNKMVEYNDTFFSIISNLVIL